MTDILLNAKSILEKEKLTCIITDGEREYKSTLRGIKPLLELVQNGTDTRGFYAADKVVGKAAAFMYILLGVKALYAFVISKPSLALLQEHGIEVLYGTLVDAIKNRNGDGFCPMEQAVKDIADPHDAVNAVIQKLEQLKAL